VLNNLVLNAKQAMPNGGRLSIAIENLVLAEGRALPLDSGTYVLISIKDTGVGIAPEDLPRVFDPYFTTRATGTGLGLASVHSIVRRHGGHVTVSSPPGEGACFRIFLPAAKSVEALSPVPRREPATTGVRNVLVVDDDATVLRVMSSMLAHLGHQVAVADSSAAAIDSFERAGREGTPFDAVFVDLTMPGDLGGLGVAACLRERDADVPIVVMSGYSVDPVMANPMARGFRGALPKPFTIDALEQALDSCFL
jgi:two-component system cell cycle sensor histidine kinase/response regulator CckA